ncbi:MAG TPA: hypothetical protein VL944_03275 [Candidatus Acidoferrum sp.]|nr:hypothetical protein [Candidatus Acidoferrum sp.]
MPGVIRPESVPSERAGASLRTADGVSREARLDLEMERFRRGHMPYRVSKDLHIHESDVDKDWRNNNFDSRRSLHLQITEISESLARYDIPKQVVERARELSDNVSELIPRQMTDIAAASLAAACIEKGIPPSLREIIHASNTRERNFYRALKAVRMGNDLPAKAHAPEAFVPYILQHLGEHRPSESEVLYLLGKIEGLPKRTYTSPDILAAAAVCMLEHEMSGKRDAVRQVSYAIGVNHRGLSHIVKKKEQQMREAGIPIHPGQ